MDNIKWKRINTPLTKNVIEGLRVSDAILISGEIFTARDKAHKRLDQMVKNNEKIPFDTKNQVLYYTGPSPAPPGKAIGAAGPTTSYRMDPYTETMLSLGFSGFIGKGKRSPEVIELLKKYKAVYFSSFGGAGAYLNKRIIKSTPVAFEEYGPEAVYRLEVVDFPVIVINDMFGGIFNEIKIRDRN